MSTSQGANLAPRDETGQGNPLQEPRPPQNGGAEAPAIQPEPSASPVLFETLPTAGGRQIGVATLNRPETLNGLSLPMCEMLMATLERWQSDPQVALVILQGSGGKAFCAGGDLHGLYQGMLENRSGAAWDNPYARRFFDVEYRLDFLLHTYGKPLLVRGGGIVMGGGVGLLMGASHRVLSETTRFAMPEITIGLFPDVGGSWMFGRLPKAVARFLAMTGAHLNASDTYYLGLADYLVPEAGWPPLLSALLAHSWADADDDNHARLSALLEAHGPAEPLADGPLRRNIDLIREIGRSSDFDAVCERIAALQGHDDAWLQRAAKSFLAGAPGSVRLSHELLERTRELSLAEVFRLEYIVSLQCGAHGDFQEGIRALLIDKDKAPRWNPPSLKQADRDWVRKFFQPPWPESRAHPLADLGQALRI